jgi:hypothetical protein
VNRSQFSAALDKNDTTVDKFIGRVIRGYIAQLQNDLSWKKTKLMVNGQLTMGKSWKYRRQIIVFRSKSIKDGCSIT